MYLETLVYTQNSAVRLAEMKEIFFLSAPENVRSAEPAKKDEFWRRWTSYYVEQCPEELYFACDLQTNRTLGYLSGCRNSLEAQPKIAESIRSFATFSDLFKKFPAHFHINTHPDARAKGVGTFLVQEYIIDLKKMKVGGVHIVTVPGERNIQFYLRNKFKVIDERPFENRRLLFMGQTL